jgi:hypothetical protein
VFLFRLTFGGAGDRCQRAQQLCRRKAANSGQAGRGFCSADIGNGLWRPGLDRHAGLGRAAASFGLLLRLARFGELRLRILSDKFAFISRPGLRRSRRGIGGRFEFSELIIAFAGPRNGRRSVAWCGIACLGLDGHRLRHRAIRRLDGFGLVRAREQVSDGRVAGASLQAQQHSRMKQRGTHRGHLDVGRRARPSGVR